MSNLSLPAMDYRSLAEMLAAAGRQQITLAYKTTAWSLGDVRSLIVKHHGTPIAHLGPMFVTLSSGGWDSQTTAGRLNTVLRAAIEKDGGEDLFVRIRGGSTVLTKRVPGRKGEVIVRHLSEGVVHLSRTTSTAPWVLHETAATVSQ